MKVKICGLKRPEDILAVNTFQPDFAGFVFAPSRRMVSLEEAAALKKILSPSITSVGVFVNADTDHILQIAGQQIIDLIQLHGDEDIDYVNRLMDRTYLPVIKAVRVADRQDILAATNFPCQYLLFDTYSKGQYGGSGKSFDWAMIPEINTPFFLAGGIYGDNLAQAQKTQAFCLDISSGAETDGYKDPKKIQTIITRIRSAES